MVAFHHAVSVDMGATAVASISAATCAFDLYCPYFCLPAIVWFLLLLFGIVVFVFAFLVHFCIGNYGTQIKWEVGKWYFSQTTWTLPTKDGWRPSSLYVVILHTVFICRVAAAEEKINFPNSMEMVM